VYQALGRKDAYGLAVRGARHLALLAGFDLAVEHVARAVPPETISSPRSCAMDPCSRNALRPACAASPGGTSSISSQPFNSRQIVSALPPRRQVCLSVRPNPAASRCVGTGRCDENSEFAGPAARDATDISLIIER
jgi:hypothetical protein